MVKGLGLDILCHNKQSINPFVDRSQGSSVHSCMTQPMKSVDRVMLLPLCALISAGNSHDNHTTSIMSPVGSQMFKRCPTSDN